MMNNKISQLASFLFDEKRDIEGMEEGKIRIQELFLNMNDFLQPGMFYGELKDICQKKISPFNEFLVQIIPEYIPFHNEDLHIQVETGQLITIDCAIKVDREWVDGAQTFGVGLIDDDRQNLLYHSKTLFDLVKTMSLPQTSFAQTVNRIQRYLKSTPCFLVPDCGGHGVGRSLHQGHDYIYSNIQSQLVYPADQAYTVEPVIGLPVKGGNIYSYFEETLINDK